MESFNALTLPAFVARLMPAASQQFTPHASSHAYHIVLESSKTIQPHDLRICFSLIESTSKADYAVSSTGWHPKAKQKEMKLPDLKYFLVRRGTSPEVLGFASFMLTYEDGREVVYLYEVHLADELRGIGLGRYLVQLVQRVGKEAGMEKIMLTVFRANQKAVSFYEKLGLTVDDFSPESRRLRNGRVKEPDYVILSKALEIDDGL